MRLAAFILIGFCFALRLANGITVLGPKAGQAVGDMACWVHVGGFITECVLIWFFRHEKRVGHVRSYHYGPW